MELKAIYEALKKSKSSFEHLEAIHSPGVYAVFLKSQTTFPFKNIDGLIYIGSTSNLAQRQFNTHFETGSSGFSTLRRSIGAILKKEFNLSAIPRSNGSSETNYKNYKFTEIGEEKITTWMTKNLEVGVYATDLDVEKNLIACFKPVLCLKDWNNPDREQIKKLREICADEAKNI
ncbi:MAG: GIY-YIG nuclease family protein [Candidatus Schekmanbacteria bacterium]|nr:GIY-YIG nuclease family protein [Candidatus Schekmanbacteria bacterium]